MLVPAADCYAAIQDDENHCISFQTLEMDDGVIPGSSLIELAVCLLRGQKSTVYQSDRANIADFLAPSS